MDYSNRTLVVAAGAAFAAAVGSGCAVTHPQASPHVKPVLAVRHAGNQADGYYQLGRFLQAQNRYEEAAEAYGKALAADPGHADAHNGMGTLHAIHGRFDEAQRSFAAALAAAPLSAAALNNSGYAYLLQGRVDEAAKAFRQAAAIDPLNPRYRSNLQRALEQQPSEPEAIRASSEPAAEMRFDAASSTQPLAAHAASANSTEPTEAGNPSVKLVSTAPNVYELVVPKAQASTERPFALASAPRSSAAGLEVSNGKGASGMARRIAGQLAEAGLSVQRLTNHKPYGKVTTHIRYRPGYEHAARSLSQRVPGLPPVVVDDGLRTGVDVRLVLGKELPVDVALVPPTGHVAQAAR